MKQLFLKDLKQLLKSGTAISFFIGFYLVSSILLWINPGEFNILYGSIADLFNFFSLAPFLFILLIPAIGMNSFFEEKNKGTINLIRMLPISDKQVVISKFLSVFALSLLTLLPSLGYVFIISDLAMSTIAYGPLIGSYSALILVLACFSAFSVFASLLSKNIFTALLLGIGLNFLMYYGWYYLDEVSGFEIGLKNISIINHYESMNEGVVYIENLLYLTSLILLGLAFAISALKSYYAKQ